jgi:hypothetical protein
MKIRLRIVLILIIIILGIFSYCFGSNIPTKDLLPFTDLLLTASAIIFGIVSAWLAIVWNIHSNQAEGKKEDVLFLKKTVLFAFFSIMFSLSSKYLYPILKSLKILNTITIVMWFRRIFIFLSGIAFLLLFFALLFSLLSFDFFSFDDNIKQQLKERKDKQKSLMQHNGNIRDVND